MYILGISAFYHDSAAVLLRDGVIVAAAQEERFTRKKHDARFPKLAIDYCLKHANISISDVELVAFYEKPFLKFERLLETYLAFAPQGFRSFLMAMPVWIKQKMWIKEVLRKELRYSGNIIFPEHHHSHAASAFFASPFQTAAIITMDGVGEWVTTSWGRGSGSKIELWADINFPHSLGMLYSAFTYYTGFKVNSGEYKLMGLAPYGTPIYKDLIYEKLITVKEDGSFQLQMDYFNYCAGLTMTSAKFHDLFGGPPRIPGSDPTQKDMDIAASIQVVIEEIVLKIAKYVRATTGESRLVLAGGVALNCVANGTLLRSKIFDEIWIQPASGDAGGALGAALIGWYEYLENTRTANGIDDFMQGSYLGPEFSNSEIQKFLIDNSIPFQELSDTELPTTVSELLSKENIIGWFQGRMEFGPRALGARSILGDARSSKTQSTMNLKIKFRESFRPFAPSVLQERVGEYFDMPVTSPYMLLVGHITPKKRIQPSPSEKTLFGIDQLHLTRSDIPAVTHVDYSARIQTVTQSTNRPYYTLLDAFFKKYNCPVIVNTSFNVRGEPIVCTPEDAYRCFMRTHMDYLVLGNFLLSKKEQSPTQDTSDWMREFELD